MILWQRLRIAAVEAVGTVIAQYKYLIIPQVPRAGRLRLRPFQHAVRRLHDAVMDVHDIARESDEPLAIYPPDTNRNPNASDDYPHALATSDVHPLLPMPQFA